MNINLKGLSDKSGKSELELVKTIATLLAIKAEVTGDIQTLILTFPKK